MTEEKPHPELLVMDSLWEALRDFPLEAQLRMLDWLQSKVRAEAIGFTRKKDTE